MPTPNTTQAQEATVSMQMHKTFPHPPGECSPHCCACLASAPHSEFDGSGCEFCDSSVIVNVGLVTGRPCVVLTNEYDSTPEFRAWLDTPAVTTDNPTGA